VPVQKRFGPVYRGPELGFPRPVTTPPTRTTIHGWRWLR